MTDLHYYPAVYFQKMKSETVCTAEKTALDRQREAKKRKQDCLRKQNLIAVQEEYAKALTYIDMFHVSDAQTAFAKLQSKTAKLEAMKEQI